MELLKGLIDPKLLKILQLFLDNKSKYFHLTDIAHKAGVPPSSTFRLMKKLLSLGFVEYSQTGKLKIYKYSKGKKMEKLEELLRMKL